MIDQRLGPLYQMTSVLQPWAPAAPPDADRARPAPDPDQDAARSSEPGSVTGEEQGVLRFAMEELDASSREIQRRSSEQFACVTTALVALGTVVALVSEFNDGNLINLLAAVPWIHAILGYVWVDHHFGIMRQGAYLRLVVEPQVRAITNAPKLGRELWCLRDRVRSEEYRHHGGANHPGKIPRSRIGTFFPWGFFVVPSLLSIAAYVTAITARVEVAPGQAPEDAVLTLLREMNWFPVYLVVLSLVFIWFLVGHIRFAKRETVRWDEEAKARFRDLAKGDTQVGARGAP